MKPKVKEVNEEKEKVQEFVDKVTALQKEYGVELRISIFPLNEGSK